MTIIFYIRTGLSLVDNNTKLLVTCFGIFGPWKTLLYSRTDIILTLLQRENRATHTEQNLHLLDGGSRSEGV